MKARMGTPKAMTATAHKLARIIYHMVTTQQPYDTTICGISVFPPLGASHSPAASARSRWKKKDRRRGFYSRRRPGPQDVGGYLRHNPWFMTPDQRRSEMLIIVLIIVLVLVFGGGGGYYGYNRWGTGGGAGIGLGTVLVILLVCYLLGLFR
jgi:hypothetical protein